MGTGRIKKKTNDTIQYNEEWNVDMQVLSDICEYRKEKIMTKEITLSNYISTENLMPNKGGIVDASSLPTVEKIQFYQKGDVLVSNIRPYFKKIWLAKESGGCSNDILVFKSKEHVDSLYLYYVLSDDSFFDYATATSKGTKMPRGDKNAIMQYNVPKFNIAMQRKIGSLLKSIDNKIEINKMINRNLSEQLKSIFVESFGEEISKTKIGNSVPLGELIDVIDNRGKTPPLTMDTLEYPIIDVGALRGDTRVIDLNNCTKFVDEDTYVNWFRSGHPKPWDILLSTVGSLAEMKIFLGKKGCIAQNVVALRSKKISPLFLFQYLQFIRNELVAYNIGSVQPSIKVTHIIKHPIFVPEEGRIKEFDELAKTITNQIYYFLCECENLKKIRDGLLPKLLSGELDISSLHI